MSHTSQEQRHELHLAAVLIGKSEQAVRMREFAERAAKIEHTILLLGETGAGKDHLAELIHVLGPQRRAFVPVDCGALTESLSESELFGHTLGAFTDARSAKPGLVEVAEGGTLFFNEVANMSLGLQAKFLRVLERKTFRAVGGTSEKQINTRIIGGTNADLELAVQGGKMRLDLYHRLNTITFYLAPLRERSEDIPELANHFLRQEHASKNFSEETMTIMMAYHWPGNVRELKNAVVRAAFHSTAEEDIKPEHVHPYLSGVGADHELPTLYELQRNYLREILKRTRGKVSKAAEIAGIDRKAIYPMIKKFQLEDFLDSLKKEV